MTFEELTTEKEDISSILKDIDVSNQNNHLTRSGRHFKPHEFSTNLPRNESEPIMGKSIEKEEVKGKGKAEEVAEENPILRQLKKTQAQISIWGLIMASHEHRQAMLDAFNEYDLDADTTPEQLVALVTGASKPVVAFTDDDLP